MKALVLGLWDNDEENSKLLNTPTSLFDKFDAKTNGSLKDQALSLGPLKFKSTRVIFKVLPDYHVVIVVGLGSINATFNDQEDLDEKKENVRKAIASAISQLRSLDENKFTEVHLDACDEAQSVAVGAIISDWKFDELKNESLKRKPLNFVLADQSNPKEVQEFEIGKNLAFYQNQSRRLQELPANHCTPTIFCDEAKKMCEPLGVKVIVHDRKWAEEKKMGSFLSVANGTDEPCKFLELHYMNAGEKRPLVFVGKGITFDSGGISIKPSASLDLMRSDMGGAANVLATIACLAKLKSKVNIVGLIPLTENLINGKATKPGDVVFAMNGKSIQIDNTDAEGRLVLADALCYADTFDPEVVLDIATLTGACKIALGVIVGACFTNSHKHWELLRECGYETGDRLWRLPLYKAYQSLVKNPPLADLNNMSNDSASGAGTILAAMFLKEFTKSKSWIHLDIANIKYTNSQEVIGKGMTGRPLRTLVRFIQKVFV